MKEKYIKNLSHEQCKQIHDAALRILKDTGVIFQNKEACEILKKSGSKVEGEKVFIPESLVKWALEKVPNKFMLYNQEGKPAFSVGGFNSYYGTGSDCLNLLDFRTNERRKPLIKDLVDLVRLCDSLENIDFLMSMIIPTDIPREITDRVQMETMLTYSNKPIIGVSFSFEGTKDIVKMAETVAGSDEELRKKPFFIHYIQPVRALFHNEDSLNKLILLSKKGLPCVYLVSAIMGFTCPITTAGYLAMGNAGQLSALVLSQLINEGTPFVVRGGRVVVEDMKTLQSTFADPRNRIDSSDIAHYYNIPCFGTGGVSDSNLMDWQAASEASLTLMADSLMGANLIHDVGYIEFGLTYSAEMLVLCDEIISWIKKFKQPVEVNKETLALNLIKKLGLKGDFLNTDHTLRHYREQWEPNIFNRESYSTWKEKGSLNSKDRIKQKIEEILSLPGKQSKNSSIIDEIKLIIEKYR